MGRMLSPPARELKARYCQLMANIPPELRTALNQRELARNAGNMNQRTLDDELDDLFERLAADP